MKTERTTITHSLLLLAILAVPAVAAAGDAKETEDGHFRVQYTSSLDPVPINRMHEWTLHVETAAGDPVEEAEITIDGGMPAHDHGLPTEPRVTEYLGGGDYRVQGLRFHMRGAWQVTFEIRHGDVRDRVTFDLAL